MKPIEPLYLYGEPDEQTIVQLKIDEIIRTVNKLIEQSSAIQ